MAGQTTLNPITFKEVLYKAEEWQKSDQGKYLIPVLEVALKNIFIYSAVFPLSFPWQAATYSMCRFVTKKFFLQFSKQPLPENNGFLESAKGLATKVSTTTQEIFAAGKKVFSILNSSSSQKAWTKNEIYFYFIAKHLVYYILWGDNVSEPSWKEEPKMVRKQIATNLFLRGLSLLVTKIIFGFSLTILAKILITYLIVYALCYLFLAFQPDVFRLYFPPACSIFSTLRMIED